MESLKALYQCRQIVAIGGGHGLGRVMASLGFMEEKLAGIVATTDDGGSTGRLREASGCIAWGDLRNCLNQLCSDSPNLARILFEYRFKNSGELSGHNLGNLIMLAMDQMCVRPLDAVNLIRKMLQVGAQLIPMSEEPARLAAMLNGEKIVGETIIDALDKRPDKLMLLPDIKPTSEAVSVIEQADMIILGPGSFMTSILPSLLMKGIAEAINNNPNALKVFVGNINPETTVVGKQPIAEKLGWMKEMTGVYPDVLLWPEEYDRPEDVCCAIRQLPLSDLHQEGAHSREAMRKALDLLAQQHLANNV
ncbi:uridine diphosphate-N-acetylglucosamine-binding protein YvcK [Endozoicomonas gorgoniicola]|uniref:Uridine diphosphate-N-acetylglucosamine-binding protein YvcK n=1 Tax=Endozoicomonas gorgoniicola TaxID=1234144 RepID=A0ABT3N464_9GAMM|nr:uridine diphosphate-N-acetylglucosamine-binding protein YvcK [Endozoicomonas gorgoniicola]MCW7556404.1 uridine diphosphate-N-acetylglucosamine-binding protein YvcK [Endozoicomonas gorgoniicola]